MSPSQDLLELICKSHLEQAAAHNHRALSRRPLPGLQVKRSDWVPHGYRTFGDALKLHQPRFAPVCFIKYTHCDHVEGEIRGRKVLHETSGNRCRFKPSLCPIHSMPGTLPLGTRKQTSTSAHRRRVHGTGLPWGRDNEVHIVLPLQQNLVFMKL